MSTNGTAAAYAAFAERPPAQYDAMFTNALDLPFASPEAPAPLHHAFAQLCQTLRPFAGEDDPETLAETFWSGLHSLLTLLHNGRLRRSEHTRRLALLIKHFARGSASLPPRTGDPPGLRTENTEGTCYDGSPSLARRVA